MGGARQCTVPCAHNKQDYNKHILLTGSVKSLPPNEDINQTEVTEL